GAGRHRDTALQRTGARRPEAGKARVAPAACRAGVGVAPGWRAGTALRAAAGLLRDHGAARTRRHPGPVMRWHRQNGIPDNPDFEPTAEDGWTALPEPPPEKLQIQALVPLALTLPVFALAWLWLLRHGARDFGPVGAWAGLLVVLPLVVVHEGIHLLLHPGHGRSSQSVLGGSSKHGIIYALYFGEMSRARYVVVLLGPFVVLSVLPL